MTVSTSTSLSSSAESDNGGSYVHYVHPTRSTRLHHSEAYRFEFVTQNYSTHEACSENGHNGVHHASNASRTRIFAIEPEAAQKRQTDPHFSFFESGLKLSSPQEPVAAPSLRGTRFGLTPVATPSTPAMRQPLCSAHPVYTALGQYGIWQGIPQNISLEMPRHYRRRFRTPGNQS